MDAKQASIKKIRSGRERRAIYLDIKELRKEYREREKECVSTLLRSSKVVLATLHGAGGYQLKNENFDVVIIDEASQALEAQCWVPLLSARKVVLAGDHLQLPPTIKSSSSSTKTPTSKPTKDKSKPDGAKSNICSLETTLFDRLLTLHGPGIKRMLTVQYRMHQKIMVFPSEALYDSRLTAGPSVATRLLTDLPSVSRTDDTIEPLIFYDTQGGDFPESSAADTNSTGTPSKSSLLTESKSNQMEAALATKHVTSLIEAGVKEGDIAVITPYNGQLSLLSALIHARFPAVELGTVDGFQGREKEAVVLTLVRSNADEKSGGGGSGQGVDVGFLSEKRRLNVGMTRPRRQLCVIADGETVGRGSAFLKKWIDFLEREADLRYPDVSGLQGVEAGAGG